jgi:DNA-binding NtrC family response regulator
VISRVAVVTADIFDKTRIEEAVRRVGFKPVSLTNSAAVEKALAESVPGIALVDLRVGEAERIIELLAAAGVEVTAFGAHVDKAGLERARAAGAIEAVPRSFFFSRLPRMFEV